jgi:hypothetical protein
MMSVYKGKDHENFQWITPKGVCVWEGEDTFRKSILIRYQYWCHGNQEMF